MKGSLRAHENKCQQDTLQTVWDVAMQEISTALVGTTAETGLTNGNDLESVSTAVDKSNAEKDPTNENSVGLVDTAVEGSTMEMGLCYRKRC